MGTTIRTATGWQAKFAGALYAAATKAGVGGLEDLEWEGVTTDATWGDRCGLVFFGATPEVNERAAMFFVAWAGKNLRKLGIVGGYQTQESISFAGEFTFTRFANGAKGWHRTRGEYTGSTELLETFKGFATSYVYYPCAD
jgi:hypothetical protein